jgi:hypothetical protein
MELAVPLPGATRSSPRADGACRVITAALKPRWSTRSSQGERESLRLIVAGRRRYSDYQAGIGRTCVGG